MKIKLFGKDLFEFRKNTNSGIEYLVSNTAATMTHIPDFKDFGSGEDWITPSLTTWSNSAVISVPSDASSGLVTIKTETKIPKPKETFTPKRIYDMHLLHDEGFSINMDTKYIDEQVAEFKSKLGFMKKPDSDYNAKNEITSIVMRMENRKKYASVRAVLEKYPYTTNKRIDNVMKKHDYLKMCEIAQFVAEMPKEATETMKIYNEACMKMCDKKAVFYIIADKKDFKRTSSRRDPILLAQSPIGHFWQILGAWDKEMLFLEDL
jgi:hypothetical protein